MKKLLFTIAIGLVGMTAHAQTVTYDELQNGSVTSGTFDTYVAKDGSVFKVGENVNFGLPSGVNGKFVYIQKILITGEFMVVGGEAVNTSATIKKIRVGSVGRGSGKVIKCGFQTKGLTGIDNYFFNIEDAILNGEIKSSVMSSNEALAELKKCKDKFDLGLMTLEEFNAKKAELSVFIK